jgi:hypothetical protein
MMQRRVILAASILACLIALAPNRGSSAGFGLEVTPGKLEISVPAGATYNIPISVRNASYDPVHVQASMVDFGVSTDGSYVFQKVGTKPYSLMKWASIRPREFDLKAGEAQQIQLSVQIPQGNLSGEYGGIVFFQTRPSRKSTRSVAFAVRVASKIYETIPGTVQINGAVTKMTSTESSKGQIYHVVFKNTGNAHVYIRGQLAIQQGSTVVDQINLADGQLVERDGERVLEASGKKLPPGTYQAIATIDYGGKTETGGAIAFDVH